MFSVYPHHLAHPENRQAITDLLACPEAAGGSGPLDWARVREALPDGRPLLVWFPIVAMRGEAGDQRVASQDETLTLLRATYHRPT